MPERKDYVRRVGAVDDSVFAYGDGSYSLYPFDPVFADYESARARWTEVRRKVWSLSNRFRPPKASQYFDGITTSGFDLLWSRGTNHPRITDIDLFAPAEILSAFESDRDAVAAFRRDERDGAATVDDFLDLYLKDISIGEIETNRIHLQIVAGAFPDVPKITSAAKYGGDAALGSEK